MRGPRSVALAVFLPFACSPTDTGSTALRLTGGSETAGSPAVVAIGFRPLLCGERLVPSCTGTLIAPRVVLTAAHCVDRPELWSVFFGSNTADAGKLVDVAEVRLHPSWSDDEGTGVDLAILLLDRAVPVEPMSLPGAETPRVAVDESVTIVGFGATVGPGTPDGAKREGTSSVSEVSEGSFRTRPGPALICDGDSGGPVIADRAGRPVLVGVSVEGDVACTTWSRHEDVAAHRGFIDEAMAIEPKSLAVPGDLCARTCSTNDDCPRFHECEEGVDGRTRCVLTPLPIGGVGSSCLDESTCGGAPCVRTLGSDGCHCHVSCASPGDASSWRAGGGGCSVSEVGR